MLTIGYIGNGKSTNRYHLPYVLNRSYINVKTIYERHPNTSTWEKVEGVTYTSDWDVLLKDPDIQLIVICTPPATHYEFAKRVLKAGKHVLVEKPFTTTHEEAKEIFELANQLGLVAQCYQNRRYDSDFLTVQKVIESNVLGELFEIVICFDYDRAEAALNSTKTAYYDSFYYGHACHSIDQVISYFGSPDHVSYDVRQLAESQKMIDYYDIDMYYDQLKVSVKASYFMKKPRPSFSVYGLNGTFIKETTDRQEAFLKRFAMPDDPNFGVDELQHYGVLYTANEDKEVVERRVASCVGDYGRVYNDLYEVIINQSEKVIQDEDTLCLMQILEAGIKRG